MWVAVGEWFNDPKNSIAISTDGMSWNALGTPILTTGKGIGWANNLWVAVGSGSSYSIATSDNGVNWTGKSIQNETPPNMSSGAGVAFNGSMWVMVGGTNSGTEPNKIVRSTDQGNTWIPVDNSANIFDYGGKGIAWNGRMWVAVGEQNSNNSIAWSINGSDWNGIGKTLLTNGTCIAWNGIVWVAGGTAGSGPGATSMCYSFDGKTWTSIYNEITEVESVAWNGATWIAVGFGNWTIAYSNDGIQWVSRGGGSPIFGFCIGYNYRRPYFVRFTTNSAIPTAIDTAYPALLLPIVIPYTSKLDVVSESYYNRGYTNFSITTNTPAL